MDMERNLFDIMQDFTPEEKLMEDDSKKMDMERVKFRVFQKKGVKTMKVKIVRRLAVAALAVIVLAGGVVSVDAATGGHIMESIGAVKITIFHKDGSEEVKSVEMKKEKDGSYTVEVEGDEDTSFSIETNETEEQK